MTFVFADVAAIIGAGAGVFAVLLAIVGVVVLFRPRFDVTIDTRREAIRVKVSNKGRLKGRINGVSVIDADGSEVSSEFASLPDEKFHSGEVAHKQARSLVIKAKNREPFAKDVRVFVQWGRRSKKTISPEQVKKEVSYFTEDSDWPPAT